MEGVRRAPRLRRRTLPPGQSGVPPRWVGPGEGSPAPPGSAEGPRAPPRRKEQARYRSVLPFLRAAALSASPLPWQAREFGREVGRRVTRR